MKIFILAFVLICLSGCAISTKKESVSNRRKSAMMACVAQFLDRDVAPRDSLGICTTVYSRWSESEYSKTSITKEGPGE